MFALIMVFLILSANYERWTLPVAVLLAVPFGLFGALLAVFVRDLSNDVYFQIGLLVLIGLAAKNAILIVEFAAQEQAKGMSAPDAAALEAARLRFRPIVMTSLAFVLGVLPLVLRGRRRRGRAALDGHRRVRRHARGDVHRHRVHPAVLRRAVARERAAHRQAPAVAEEAAT